MHAQVDDEPPTPQGRIHYEALLPGDIDADQVAASYQDGLLVVRPPKPESKRAKVRKIEVK